MCSTVLFIGYAFINHIPSFRMLIAYISVVCHIQHSPTPWYEDFSCQNSFNRKHYKFDSLQRIYQPLQAVCSYRPACMAKMLQTFPSRCGSWTCRSDYAIAFISRSSIHTQSEALAICLDCLCSLLLVSHFLVPFSHSLSLLFSVFRAFLP